VKNITLTVKSTVPGLVIGDPTRLQQIIWNLLVNAIKFTPPHGHVDAAVVSEAGRIVLTVSDSGCGIHPSFLPHVFEPFRQAESTTSGLSGGLGIGLSIVRQLIELHGGTITAQSAGAGLGSAFIVSLPAAREELIAYDERVPVAAISA
jgi:signal transduction histidine kinase